MLEKAVWDVYTKFKLHFYLQIFRQFQSREASLTTVETYCMETIQALGQPTVNEFATFAGISPPNAAYKVASLIRKGYLQKVRSKNDRREYHLQVTDKYLEYYNIGNGYVLEVMERVRKRFSAEECRELERMMQIIGDELMPEVDLARREPLQSEAAEA